MNEIDSLLEEFERNPEDLDVQIKILNLVSKIPDVSELVQKIMRRCVSKLDKKDTHTAFGLLLLMIIVPGRQKKLQHH